MSANTEYLRGQIEERSGAMSQRPGARFTERGNDVWARRSGRTFLDTGLRGGADFSSPVAGSGMGNLSRLVGGRKKRGGVAFEYGKPAPKYESMYDRQDASDATREANAKKRAAEAAAQKKILPGATNKAPPKKDTNQATSGRNPARDKTPKDWKGWSPEQLAAMEANNTAPQSVRSKEELFGQYGDPSTMDKDSVLSARQRMNVAERNIYDGTPDRNLDINDPRNPDSKAFRYNAWRKDQLENSTDPFQRIVRGLTKIGDFAVDQMASGPLSAVPGAKAIAFVGRQGAKLNPNSKFYDSGYDDGTKGIGNYVASVGKDAAMELGKYAMDKGKEYVQNQFQNYMNQPTAAPPRGNLPVARPEYPALEDRPGAPAIMDRPNAPAPPTSRPSAPAPATKRPPPPPPPRHTYPGGEEALDALEAARRGDPLRLRDGPLTQYDGYTPPSNARMPPPPPSVPMPSAPNKFAELPSMSPSGAYKGMTGLKAAKAYQADVLAYQAQNFPGLGRGMSGGAMDEWAAFTAQNLRGNIHPRRGRGGNRVVGGSVLGAIDMLQEGQNMYEGAGMFDFMKRAVTSPFRGVSALLPGMARKSVRKSEPMMMKMAEPMGESRALKDVTGYQMAAPAQMAMGNQGFLGRMGHGQYQMAAPAMAAPASMAGLLGRMGHGQYQMAAPAQMAQGNSFMKQQMFRGSGRVTKAEKEAMAMAEGAERMGMSLDAHLKHNKVPAAKRRTIAKRVANARRKMGE